MEKQYNNKPSLELERPTEQLDFNQMDEEARELLERDRLPTPTELEKYNQLIPNGAERILNIIEDERTSRREIQLKKVSGRNTTNNLMVIFGFVFGFFLLMFITIIATNVGGSFIGYVLIWATMVIVLGIIFAPYIKSRFGNKN